VRSPPMSREEIPRDLADDRRAGRVDRRPARATRGDGLTASATINTDRREQPMFEITNRYEFESPGSRPVRGLPRRGGGPWRRVWSGVTRRITTTRR